MSILPFFGSGKKKIKFEDLQDLACELSKQRRIEGEPSIEYQLKVMEEQEETIQEILGDKGMAQNNFNFALKRNALKKLQS